MCTLIASFCVISPTVILYTAGYRFNIHTRTITETGVLTIDVVPKDAHVVVNTIDLNLSMPIRLPNRTAGVYDVTITRPGYLSWTQSVQIKSKQTTYITDLYLFLEALPTLEYPLDTTVLTTTYAPDANVIVTLSAEEDAVIELTSYSLSTSQQQTLWRGVTTSTPYIYWSQHAPLLAISTQDDQGNTTIQTKDMSRAENLQSYKIYTTSTLPIVQWHEHGANILYTQEQDDIIALSSGNKRTLFTTTSSLWFVDSNEDVWHIDPKERQLFKNGFSITHILNTDSITEIVDTRTTHMLVRTDRGFGVLWLDSGELTFIPGEHIRSRTYGKSWSTWIVWSEWEVIEVLESGDTILLTRTNEPIQDLSTSPKHGTLFFVLPHKIIAFHPEYRTTHVLFESSSEEPMRSIATDSDNAFIMFDTSLNNRRGIFKRLL